MTMDRTALEETAQAMVAGGKGMLAADESNTTMTKRLDAVGIESTPESRRGFRGLMFTAEGAAHHISGVIMYDETLRQASDDGEDRPTHGCIEANAHALARYAGPAGRPESCRSSSPRC
jgi:fructose-bisphosphate aldolase, class I